MACRILVKICCRFHILPENHITALRIFRHRNQLDFIRKVAKTFCKCGKTHFFPTIKFVERRIKGYSPLPQIFNDFRKQKSLTIKCRNATFAPVFNHHPMQRILLCFLPLPREIKCFLAADIIMSSICQQIPAPEIKDFFHINISMQVVSNVDCGEYIPFFLQQCRVCYIRDEFFCLLFCIHFCEQSRQIPFVKCFLNRYRQSSWIKDLLSFFERRTV